MAFRSSHFGPGIGTIHLDEVRCSGGEGRLINCVRASSVNCNRGHTQDAGVRCRSEGLVNEHRN